MTMGAPPRLVRAARWSLEPVRQCNSHSDDTCTGRLATVLCPLPRPDDEGGGETGGDVDDDSDDRSHQQHRSGVLPTRAYLCLHKLEHDRPVFKVEELRPSHDGSVLLGSGSLLCMKAFEKSNKDGMTRLGPELEALSLASTPDAAEAHVVGLLEVLQDRDRIYVITPYFPGGDFYRLLDSTGVGLPEHTAKRYLRHVVRALLFLKQKLGIAHGDVSLENVVLSASDPPTAHLIDLGGCCVPGPNGLCPADAYHFRGKVAYMPCEVVTGSPCQPIDVYAVDVWAVGVLTYMMLCGRPLYVDAVEDAAFRALCHGKAADVITHFERYGEQFKLDPLAKDFIVSLLQPLPSDRPRLEDLMEHPWLGVRGGEEEAGGNRGGSSGGGETTGYTPTNGGGGGGGGGVHGASGRGCVDTDSSPGSGGEGLRGSGSGASAVMDDEVQSVGSACERVMMIDEGEGERGEEMQEQTNGHSARYGGGGSAGGCGDDDGGRSTEASA